MEESLDKVIEHCQDEAFYEIRRQVETSELTELEIAEVFFSVADALRLEGNKLRVEFRQKTSDRQFTKHK